jgi:hypothetical protein
MQNDSYSHKEMLFEMWPEPMPANDYVEARQWLRNYATQYSDIQSIYEYGSVHNPGISDLDLIFVLKDSPINITGDTLNSDLFPQKVQKALAFATLMVLPEKNFNQIILWDDLKLTHLYGKQYKFLNPSLLEANVLNVCRVVDWLPERCVRFQQLCSQKHPLPVRKALGLLKTLVYSLESLSTHFGLTHGDWSQYREDVMDLRAKWFLSKNGEMKLVKLIKKANSISHNAWDEFSHHPVIREMYRLDQNKKHAKFTFPDGATYHFGSELPTGLSDGLPRVNFPSGMQAHFYMYSREEGMISAELKKALNPLSCEIDLNLIDVCLAKMLKKRIALCNDWAFYLKSNGFAKGLFKYGWFYRN